VSQPKEQRIDKWKKVQQDKKKSSLSGIHNEWSMEKGLKLTEVNQRPVNMSGLVEIGLTSRKARLLQ